MWNPIRQALRLATPSLPLSEVSPAAPADSAAKSKTAVEKLYRCGRCGGTGSKRRRTADRTTCPVCQSHGTNRLRPPVVGCAYCQGSGQTRRNTRLGCPVCQGRGLLSVTEPFRTCPKCRGSGATLTSSLPCLGCKGAGVVTVAIPGSTISQKFSPPPTMMTLREWKKVTPAENRVPFASPTQAQTIGGLPAVGEVPAGGAEGVPWRLENRVFGEEPHRSARRCSLFHLAGALRQRERLVRRAGLREEKLWWQARPVEVPASRLGNVVHLCALCHGTGKCHSWRGECPSCSGAGTVRLEPPVVRCALCRGRGRATNSLHLACLACRGKGVHPAEGALSRCPRCRGTGGWRALACTECSGKGLVVDRRGTRERTKQVWPIVREATGRLEELQGSAAQLLC